MLDTGYCFYWLANEQSSWKPSTPELISLAMGPRNSRRLAHIHLPEAKRIFDVDRFRQDQPFNDSNIPSIRELSTGERNILSNPVDMAELKVHFWHDVDDKKPVYTETVGLPKLWTSKMYLAAFLQCYSMHKCICIRTTTNECSPVLSTFRTLSIVSSLFACTTKELEDSLCIHMQAVQGGSII